MPKDLIGSGRLRVGINRQDTRDHVGNFIDTDRETLVSVENYDNGNIPVVAVSRATGGVVTPTNVANNDQLGSFAFQGYSNSFLRTAAMEAYVDAAVVAGQRPASRMVFKTNVNNATPRLVGYFSNEGYLGIGTAFDPSVAATRAAHVIHVVGPVAGAQPYVTVENYDAAQHARFRVGKARGTFAVPSTVVTGDTLGSLEFFAYTNQWHECSEVAAQAEGTIVAGTTPDSALLFNTTFGGSILTRVRLFSTGRMGLGDGHAQTVATATNNGQGALWIAYNDSTAPLALQRASANSGGSSLYFRKSRGTLAAPATVQADDELAYIQGNAYTNAWHDNVGAIAMYVDGAVTAGQRPGNRIAFRTGVSGAGGPSDRMIIYSGGTVLIGSGSVDTTRTLHVNVAGGTVAIVRFQATAGGGTNHVLRLDGGDNATTGSNFVAFHRPDGTEIGTIKQNAANTVQYNTTSDARLKENVRDLPEVRALIEAIRPRLFNFKGDAEHIMHGFIAQELHTVFPEAVSVGGGEDCACYIGEEDADGKICLEHKEDCCHAQPWSVEYARLVPLLVKAVQELYSRLPA